MFIHLLSKLKNAQMAHQELVHYKAIGFCTEILDVLWDNGYIGGYTRINEKSISIKLLYEGGNPLLKYLLILSKPTRKIYASCADIANLSGMGGVFIVSTTCGIMSSSDAIRRRLGGEVLAYFE